MPTPTPSPVVPPQTPSFSGTNLSGADPTTSGLFAGPHFITEQTLEFDYVRVPKYDPSATFTVDEVKALTLSADSVVNDSLGGLNNNFHTLAIRIKEAKVTTRIDYSTYDTSTFEQPQKFEIYALSTDAVGNTYTGSYDASTLGPRGTIKTSQIYKSRVPYDSSNPLHIEQEIEGTNGYNYYTYLYNPLNLGSVGNPGGAAQVYVADPGSVFMFNNTSNNFAKWKLWSNGVGNYGQIAEAGSITIVPPDVWGLPPNCCPQPYAPDDEYDPFWYQLIDKIADQIKSGNGLQVRNIPMFSEVSNLETGYAPFKLSLYEKFRHDYS